MDNELAYYREQGILSNPASYVYLFENLPGIIEELVRVVQGTTIHVFWAERNGYKYQLSVRVKCSCAEWKNDWQKRCN